MSTFWELDVAVFRAAKVSVVVLPLKIVWDVAGNRSQRFFLRRNLDRRPTQSA
jgi:hypothetical protein